MAAVSSNIIQLCYESINAFSLSLDVSLPSSLVYQVSIDVHCHRLQLTNTLSLVCNLEVYDNWKIMKGRRMKRQRPIVCMSECVAMLILIID